MKIILNGFMSNFIDFEIPSILIKSKNKLMIKGVNNYQKNFGLRNPKETNVVIID